MLTLALALSALVPFDTLVFEDGTTHVLDETSVAPDDDILVRGIGMGGGQRTTVILVGAAEARSVTLQPGATVRLTEDSRVQAALTEGMSSAFQVLRVQDDAEVVGAMTLATNSTATLTGSASVGSVSVGFTDQLILEGDAVVTGDVVADGRVSVTGGTVLGAMDLRGGILVDEARGPLVFTGPVRLGGGARLSLQRSRFLSDLEAAGLTRLDLGGTSAVQGVLGIRENASAILTAASASIPSRFVTNASGVITAIDTAGDHAFYVYERDPSATFVVEALDAPTSTTSCVQTVPNSTGAAAHVVALGGSFASAGELILRANQLPSNSFSFFFVGDALVPGTTQSGDICTGGNLGRFVGPGQVMTTGQSDSITVSFDTTQIPGNPSSAALPGATYYFQVWNRDFVDGMPTSRFSDTAAVTFR